MSNEELINTIVNTADQANQLDAAAQRMVVTMYRLLAEAKPVSPARFGNALGVSREEVDHIIAMVPIPFARSRAPENVLIQSTPAFSRSLATRPFPALAMKTGSRAATLACSFSRISARVVRGTII